MNNPQHLYWLLLAVLVLPSSFFSRVAAVIIVTFGLNFVIWNAQLPETLCMMGIYAGGFIASMWMARRLTDFLVAVLFLPLAVAASSSAIGGISEWAAYWIIFWLAIVQALMMPRAVIWNEVWYSLRRGRMPRLFPPYERAIDVPALVRGFLKKRGVIWSIDGLRSHRRNRHIGKFRFFGG